MRKTKQIQPQALGSLEAWQRTMTIRSRLGWTLAIMAVTVGGGLLVGWLVHFAALLMGVF